MRIIQSSNLEGFEFTEEDPEAQTGTLRVKFRNGRTYEYVNVLSEEAQALHDAADNGESVGSLFGRTIRKAYTGHEVTE